MILDKLALFVNWLSQYMLTIFVTVVVGANIVGALYSIANATTWYGRLACVLFYSFVATFVFMDKITLWAKKRLDPGPVVKRRVKTPSVDVDISED